MSEDPLLGPKLKIKRAKEHIGDLERRINAFEADHPYETISYTDPDTGERITKLVKIKQPIPPYWGTIIGDAVHNLRSSLDLLACALVTANGNSPHRGTTFPFASKAECLEAAIAKRINGASEDAKRLARDLKPYPGGNDPLWKLHEIDIRDKHRLLIPVGAAHSWSRHEWELRDTSDSGSMRMRMRKKGRAPFPLKEGSELSRQTPPKTNFPAEYEAHFQHAIDVAFGEGQIFDGEPVVATLNELASVAEGVLALSESQIFLKAR